MLAGRTPFVVLVVEDEWLVRNEISSEFNAQGLEVLEAASGEAALELFGDEPDRHPVYRHRAERGAERLGCCGGAAGVKTRSGGYLHIRQQRRPITASLTRTIL